MCSIYLAPRLVDNTTRISAHIWLLTGFPNVVFVVGDEATLVVDTGLGAENGALVAGVARRLSRGSKLLLTTTHFHPEHAAGVSGFPSDTTLIRPRVQQEEMDELGDGFMELFRSMPEFTSFVSDIGLLRPADVLFDSETTLDLGAVRVSLLHLGAGHTVGDELVFVEQDRAVITGDIVQNKVVPVASSPAASYASWLAVLARLQDLDVELVVPTHSAIGGRSLIDDEIGFIVDMREKAAAFRADGLTAEESVVRLLDRFEASYPAWAQNPDMPNRSLFRNFALKLYAEVA